MTGQDLFASITKVALFVISPSTFFSIDIDKYGQRLALIVDLLVMFVLTRIHTKFMLSVFKLFRNYSRLILVLSPYIGTIIKVTNPVDTNPNFYEIFPFSQYIN